MGGKFKFLVALDGKFNCLGAARAGKSLRFQWKRAIASEICL